ncbi:hypothetical protein LJC02_03725 [Breznakia sp. OttesenSCG-928-G09]|nr:hypothetical protein [Breznakia sp. OttesenSCG-928-G09]
MKKKPSKWLAKLTFILLVTFVVIGQLTMNKLGAEDNSSDTKTEDVMKDVDEKISFRSIQPLMFEDVPMYLEVNGVVQEITISPGLVSDAVEKLTLEDGVKFQRAVLRREEGGNTTEVDIIRVGKLDDEIYYSLANQQNTGILLKENEKLVIVCKSVYGFTYEYDPLKGSVSGPATTWKDDAVDIHVKAEKYHHISKIEYIDKNNVVTQVSISDNKDMTFSIPASALNGDMRVKVEFLSDALYTITEAPSDGIQQGDLCLNATTSGEFIPSVTPGSTQSFMLFSQSWTGGDEWYLNMLAINGESVEVPLVYDIGSTTTTTLKNGSIVTIELTGKGASLAWKAGDSSKKRCLYVITVSDIQEDMVLTGNFKLGGKREMIIRDMIGISKVGAAKQTVVRNAWVSGTGYDNPGDHFFYNLQPNDGDTVYDAYYKERDNVGDPAQSYNIYLYTVKPGYNPNTATYRVYYNGVEGDYSKIFLASGNAQEVAASLVTNYRHFDPFKKLGIAGGGKINGDGFFVEAAREGYTHVFALKEHPANNQVIDLKATPYQYNLIFDMDGGTYANTDLNLEKYTLNGTTATEKKSDGSLVTYTLEHDTATAHMPVVAPKKEDYFFKGWKLYKDGVAVSDTLYSLGQSFEINEDTIAYAKGDLKYDEGHTFTFVAQWSNVFDSTDTAEYDAYFYKEDPLNGTHVHDGKKYTIVKEINDFGTVGGTIVVLNDFHPGSDYELNNDSKVKIVGLKDETESGYKAHNQIIYYYDLIPNKLTIEKTVSGSYANRSTAFEIEIQLINPDKTNFNGTIDYTGKTTHANNPALANGTLTFIDGKASITLKHGQSITFETTPGVEYKVIAKPSTRGYEFAYTGTGTCTNEHATGTLSDDHEVLITGTRDYIPDMGIQGSPLVVIFMGVVGLSGILVKMIYRKRKC